MKIKVHSDFRDRNTKKLIPAGTIVEADELRLSLLTKYGIKYDIVEEPSLLDGNVEQVKKSLKQLENNNLLELLDAEKNGKNRKSIIEYIEMMIEGD